MENYVLHQIRTPMLYYINIGLESAEYATPIPSMQRPGLKVGRDIPIFGTTHADHLTVDIPCAAPLSETDVQTNYETATGYQIIRCLEERKLAYPEVEMILVGHHAPFTWGVSASKAVYNSSVLENIAHMALLTLQLNPEAARLPEALIKKHFERKHGPNSYYGQ